jgi:hypothetical protein
MTGPDLLQSLVIGKLPLGRMPGQSEIVQNTFSRTSRRSWPPGGITCDRRPSTQWPDSAFRTMRCCAKHPRLLCFCRSLTYKVAIMDAPTQETGPSPDWAVTNGVGGWHILWFLLDVAAVYVLVEFFTPWLAGSPRPVPQGWNSSTQKRHPNRTQSGDLKIRCFVHTYP